MEKQLQQKIAVAYSVVSAERVLDYCILEAVAFKTLKDKHFCATIPFGGYDNNHPSKQTLFYTKLVELTRLFGEHVNFLATHKFLLNGLKQNSTSVDENVDSNQAFTGLADTNHQKEDADDADYSWAPDGGCETPEKKREAAITSDAPDKFQLSRAVLMCIIFDFLGISRSPVLLEGREIFNAIRSKYPKHSESMKTSAAKISISRELYNKAKNFLLVLQPTIVETIEASRVVAEKFSRTYENFLRFSKHYGCISESQETDVQKLKEHGEKLNSLFDSCIGAGIALNNSLQKILGHQISEEHLTDTGDATEAQNFSRHCSEVETNESDSPTSNADLKNKQENGLLAATTEYSSMKDLKRSLVSDIYDSRSEIVDQGHPFQDEHKTDDTKGTSDVALLIDDEAPQINDAAPKSPLHSFTVVRNSNDIDPISLSQGFATHSSKDYASFIEDRTIAVSDLMPQKPADIIETPEDMYDISTKFAALWYTNLHVLLRLIRWTVAANTFLPPPFLVALFAQHGSNLSMNIAFNEDRGAEVASKSAVDTNSNNFLEDSVDLSTLMNTENIPVAAESRPDVALPESCENAELFEPVNTGSALIAAAECPLPLIDASPDATDVIHNEQQATDIEPVCSNALDIRVGSEVHKQHHGYSSDALCESMTSAEVITRDEKPESIMDYSSGKGIPVRVERKDKGVDINQLTAQEQHQKEFGSHSADEKDIDLPSFSLTSISKKRLQRYVVVPFASRYVTENDSAAQRVTPMDIDSSKDVATTDQPYPSITTSGTSVAVDLQRSVASKKLKETVTGPPLVDESGDVSAPDSQVGYNLSADSEGDESVRCEPLWKVRSKSNELVANRATSNNLFFVEEYDAQNISMENSVYDAADLDRAVITTVDASQSDETGAIQKAYTVNSIGGLLADLFSGSKRKTSISRLDSDEEDGAYKPLSEQSSARLSFSSSEAEPTETRDDSLNTEGSKNGSESPFKSLNVASNPTDSMAEERRYNERPKRQLSAKAKAYQETALVLYEPKKRIRWTLDEEKALVDAVNTHGVGRWRQIQGEMNVDKVARTNGNLKDKWANLLKYGHVKKIGKHSNARWVLQEG